MGLPPVPRDPARIVWLSQLGFLEDPFSSAPDPRFLYLSGQHGPAVDRMHELVERRRGLAVVDGARALGKSMIAHRLDSFYRSRRHEYRVGVLHAPAFDSEYTAYLGLCAAFNLQARKGIANQWAEFESFVGTESEDGRVTLIIVDEAEGLSPASLAALDRVGQELAPVFLFGRDKLQLALAEVPEVLTRAVRTTLTPLSLRDTRGLVRFRCLIAGREQPLFSDDALEFMWEAAYGIPGDLVEVCNLAISELRARQAEFVDVEIARAASDSYVAYGALPEGIVVPEAEGPPS